MPNGPRVDSRGTLKIQSMTIDDIFRVWNIEHDSFVYNMNTSTAQRLRPGDAFIVDQKTTTGQKKMAVR